MRTPPWVPHLLGQGAFFWGIGEVLRGLGQAFVLTSHCLRELCDIWLGFLPLSLLGRGEERPGLRGRNRIGQFAIGVLAVGYGTRTKRYAEKGNAYWNP